MTRLEVAALGQYRKGAAVIADNIGMGIQQGSGHNLERRRDIVRRELEADRSTGLHMEQTATRNHTVVTSMSNLDLVLADVTHVTPFRFNTVAAILV
jgi:hypothetical protein